MSVADKVLEMLSLSSAENIGAPLSAVEQESLYTAAFQFYEMANYAKAAELFSRLTQVNPFEEAFWKGLAGCHQMQGLWTEALHGWALCALLSEKDPLPHFHAAECLASNGEKEEAMKALSRAKELCKEQNNTSLLAKIVSMQELI